MGNYLVKYLESLDFSVEKQDVGPTSDKRFNILAYPGKERQTRILITSHIDTVPPFIPYSLSDDGSTIWGRASSDAKGSVAAQIFAVTSLLKSGRISKDDVSLLFVVGEETNGDGMRRANDFKLSWESVIFGEPTEGKLASGHKGMLVFTLRAKGRAAHSGYPWLGSNANDILVPALASLEALKDRLPRSKKYGETTMNIGMIQGGVAANVIPERAEAQIAIRIAGGSPDEVKSMVLEAINATASNSEEEGLSVEFLGGAYGPVHMDADVEGFETITVNYGTDIPNLKGEHKRYLYGPGSILVAHGPNEHVEVEDLERAVEDYKKLILATLGKS